MNLRNTRSAKVNFDKDQERTGTISIKLFILKYLMLMAAFVFIKNFKPTYDMINIYGQYNEFIAFFSSNVLSLINIPSSSQGPIIYLPSIALQVWHGCSGIEAVLMYSVAILAYPGRWKNRLIGIIAGFIVIQALNFIRILGLAYSAVHFNFIFEVLHMYVSQSIIVGAALLIFIVYLNFSGSAKKVVT